MINKRIIRLNILYQKIKFLPLFIYFFCIQEKHSLKCNIYVFKYIFFKFCCQKEFILICQKIQQVSYFLSKLFKNQPHLVNSFSQGCRIYPIRRSRIWGNFNHLRKFCKKHTISFDFNNNFRNFVRYKNFTTNKKICMITLTKLISE